MSVPPGMMGGGGMPMPGMPPGGGPMPGAPMPGGQPGPGGPVDDVMKLLASMQESPSPSGEEQMLHQAAVLINAAFSRINLRSAKAAKFLSMANSSISSAREALNEEGSRPMAAPPNLGMPETAGMNPGAMSGF